MPKLEGEKLSRLYPAPKSYSDLAAERKRRELAKRPEHVPLKISTWLSLGVLVVLLTYKSVYSIIQGSFEANTSVISGVSFSILLTIVCFALLAYLYSLIDGLAAKIIVNNSPFHALLVGILFLSGLTLTILDSRLNNSFQTGAAAVIVSFALTFIVSRLLLKP